MNEEEGQPYYIVPRCEKQIDILYQDEYLLLINKPEFLLSVPGRAPENKDCVITRLQENFPDAIMVHRLDLDTSGIMVVPIVRSAMSHIARQFQERNIDKTYEAVVAGIVDDDAGSVDLPIVADWSNRPMQKICYEKGKSAYTEYEVLSRDEKNNTTRLLFKPLTGRSHQLRIHSREMGHAIVGCDMYAPKDVLAMSPRLLLHATCIELTHPVTGERLRGESPAPF